ncbi:polysaccharide deacetylase family protein [Viridibacillus sp. YIM B01967]|uniref:Polysaccharide deacetylase family protein n=1 Tax=Viridibacillus soli TaxID=2798301 RepID=A0ABS1H7Y0_9BACL|nr:polysaccharide deacetylase family protein [Viridibacillus soli]MBK3495505.1 polysaccharide deacetylase family protein [Viridibacillus soli]
MTTSRPKKRGLWIDTILISSILILSAILLFLFISSKTDKDSSVANGVALAAEPELKTKASEYSGITIATIISEDPRMPYSIQYPQTDNKAFNKVIKDAVYKTRDTYLEEMEKRLQKDAKKVGNLTITFDTLQHKKNYYSFVLTTTTYKGTGYKDQTVQTFMYDNKNNKQLYLNDVIKNENNLVKLASLVQQQIINNDKLKTYANTEKLKNATKPTFANYKHFSLTESNLYIYFDGEQLSNDIKSISEIRVPLTSLNSILAKPFQLEEKTANKLVKKKQIALTFDDGPNAKVTPKVLKTLKKYDAKATFFMLGSQAMYNQKLAKKVADAGHEIGNHSFSHANLKNLSNAKIKSELTRTNQEIKNVTGKNPTLFRPPYGSVDKRVRAQTNLPCILWDVDTLDWKYRNAKSLLTMIKMYAGNGDIILMHDIHPTTAQGLDAVLAYLQKQGFEFVTVSELRK